MEKLDQQMMMTVDPTTTFPALTTLLYKVCDQDTEKFDEACRLVRLFMMKASEK